MRLLPTLGLYLSSLSSLPDVKLQMEMRIDFPGKSEAGDTRHTRLNAESAREWKKRGEGKANSGPENKKD